MTDKKRILKEGEIKLEECKLEEAHAPAAEGGEAEGGEAQEESPFEKAAEVIEKIREPLDIEEMLFEPTDGMK